MGIVARASMGGGGHNLARREGDINNAVTEREGWRARASGGIHMHITDLRAPLRVSTTSFKEGHKMKARDGLTAHVVISFTHYNFVPRQCRHPVHLSLPR